MKLLVAATIAVVLTACSGSSAKTPSSGVQASGTTVVPSGASSTIPTGNDQKNSPFCQDLNKLNAITDPTKDPQTVAHLLTDGTQQAPAALQTDFAVLARYLGGGLGAGTTVPLSSADQAALTPAIEAIAAYAQAHCGINLAPAG
jgi:hypothetical protein